MAREWVWLVCSETGDLNYRMSVNPKTNDMKKIINKFNPRLRKNTPHKIKKGK
ncbi:MAG: 50S ribosomal protein L33 [Phycisphaerae bacterium]|jgi:large subunit ribosomal protein L33